MNTIHSANHKGWDVVSKTWQARVDAAGVWRKAHLQPELVFAAEELRWLRNLEGKQVAVLGSGDNLAVFALAGMGAGVTSVDISQEQLNCAIHRARDLDLQVKFVRADVTELTDIPSESMDAVYTGGHVAVWVSDLRKYYSEAARILVPGGLLIVTEYHPFRRIASAAANGYTNETRYLNRGPFEYDRASDNSLAESYEQPLPSYEFHWAVSDYIGAILAAECEIIDCSEFGDKFYKWEGLVDANIPEWLMLVGRKR